MVTVTSFGFVMLVLGCGIGIGYFVRLIEDECRKGEEDVDY